MPIGRRGDVAARPVSSLCHVLALRTAAEADRPPRAGGTTAQLHRLLLALRPPGERLVRSLIRGGPGGGAARFDHPPIHWPHRHVDHGEPAGRAVREILAASPGNGAGAADRAAACARRAEPDREPGASPAYELTLANISLVLTPKSPQILSIR